MASSSMAWSEQYPGRSSSHKGAVPPNCPPKPKSSWFRLYTRPPDTYPAALETHQVEPGPAVLTYRQPERLASGRPKSMLKKSKRLATATLKRATTRQEWQPAGARPAHGPLLAETTPLGAHIAPRGRSDGHLGRVRHHGVSRAPRRHHAFRARGLVSVRAYAPWRVRARRGRAPNCVHAVTPTRLDDEPKCSGIDTILAPCLHAPET